MPTKIVRFPKPLLTPELRSELACLRRRSVGFGAEEFELLDSVGHGAFALYVQLSFLCDAAGLVQDATYDSLRRHMRADDLTMVSRSYVRACLLELDDAGLIRFDRATPTRHDAALGIRLPWQVSPPDLRLL